MIEDWPPGVQHLLLSLGAEPRSKAELLTLANIPEAHWRAAIDYLVARGWCEHTGEAGPTRYALKQEEIEVEDQAEEVVLMRAHGYSLRAIAEACDLSVRDVRSFLEDREPPRLIADVGREQAEDLPEADELAAEPIGTGDAVGAILAALSDVPRARGEILELTGIDVAVWRQSIGFLLDRGLAIRTGSRRGTRYTIGTNAANPITAGPSQPEGLTPKPSGGQVSPPPSTDNDDRIRSTRVTKFEAGVSLSRFSQRADQPRVRTQDVPHAKGRVLVQQSNHDIVDELLDVLLAGDDESISTDTPESPEPLPRPTLVEMLEAKGA